MHSPLGRSADPIDGTPFGKAFVSAPEGGLGAPWAAFWPGVGLARCGLPHNSDGEPRRRICHHGPMAWIERREGWTDERVASDYDARRFGGPMQRRKHANDARLVTGLLARAGTHLEILDAPTGTGRMVQDLLAAGHRVTGIDLSEPMLHQAKLAASQEDAGFRGYLSGEIERLPFQNDAFDAVISLRFLFHAKDPAVRAALLTEFHRVSHWLVGHVRSRENLKHAGRWLRSQAGLSRRYRPAQGRRELAEELANSGWELTECSPVSRVFSDKVLFLAKRLP